MKSAEQIKNANIKFAYIAPRYKKISNRIRVLSLYYGVNYEYEVYKGLLKETGCFYCEGTFLQVTNLLKQLDKFMKRYYVQL